MTTSAKRISLDPVGPNRGSVKIARPTLAARPLVEVLA
jgi:hypothetical protein